MKKQKLLDALQTLPDDITPTQAVRLFVGEFLDVDTARAHLCTTEDVVALAAKQHIDLDPHTVQEACRKWQAKQQGKAKRARALRCLYANGRKGHGSALVLIDKADALAFVEEQVQKARYTEREEARWKDTEFAPDKRRRYQVIRCPECNMLVTGGKQGRARHLKVTGHFIPDTPPTKREGAV